MQRAVFQPFMRISDPYIRVHLTMRCRSLHVSTHVSFLLLCLFYVSPVLAAASHPFGSRLIIDAAKKLQPSVVHIRVKPKGIDGNPLLNLFGRGRQKDNPPKFDQGNVPFSGNYNVGSGIIVSQEGHILTNYHVIKNAQEIMVKLHEGEEFSARLLGVDDKTDLALIKIKPTKKLQEASLGDSDTIDVGQWVIAIGSPFGLANSLSVGIISAKGRDLKEGPYDEYLQTDASINPGNSGGPLANSEGDVIGVNTVIFSSGSRAWSLGIGFAIPINQAKAVIDSLRHKGYPVRGRIGAAISAVPRQEGKNLGLARFEGAKLTQVTRDGPADRAGLHRGDVVIEFDGKSVSTWQSLPRIVARTKPNSLVLVKYYREKRLKSVYIRIGSQPEAPNSRMMTNHTDMGMKVESLTPHLAQRFGLTYGENKLVISSILRGGIAELGGIRPGDVIEEVNHKPVKTIEEFKSIVDKSRLEGSVLLLLKRKETNLFAALQIK